MITRTAIIICSPSKGEKYLSGAAKDLRNMKNFLMSPRGGSWHEREIFCLTDPSWAEVKTLLASLDSSYQFVYFAGHGCSGDRRERYVEFKGGVLVEDTELISSVKKQLIVIDACRVYYAAISGIPPAEAYLNFTGDSARTVFDQCIERSPDGRVIIHATQHNEAASEDRYGHGGAFTLALLKVALNFRNRHDYQVFSIKQLLPSVKKELVSGGYKQTPSTPYETGDLLVPFLIDTDQITVAERTDDVEHTGDDVYAQPAKKISLGELALVGLCVFALIKAFGD